MDIMETQMDACTSYYTGSFIQTKKKLIRCKHACKLTWCDNSALDDDGQTMNKCKSNCSFRYLNFFDRIQRNVTLWPEEQPQECPLPLGLR